MYSFWEKRNFFESDIVIVGAGITGLSTALSLRDKFKDKSISILEKAVIPTGASTRNAGFACFGSLSELIADRAKWGPERMLQLVEARWKGLEKLKTRLKPADIGLSYNGGYELIRKSAAHYLDDLDEINKLLKPVFKINVFTEKSTLVQRFGFNSATFETVIENPFEGQLDPGKVVRQLRSSAGEKTFSSSRVPMYSKWKNHLNM